MQLVFLVAQQLYIPIHSYLTPLFNCSKGPRDPTALTSRQIAKKMNIARSSVNRMYKRLHYHFYRCRVSAEKLTQRGKDRRVTFGEVYNSLTKTQKEMIVWTDESFISLHGVVHRGHIGRFNLLRTYGSRRGAERAFPAGPPASLNTYTKPKFDKKVCSPWAEILAFEVRVETVDGGVVG